MVTVHETLEDAWEVLAPERVFAFTTTASTSYADIEYRPGDVFMFGPESVGLPAEVQQDPQDVYKRQASSSSTTKMVCASLALTVPP